MAEVVSRGVAETLALGASLGRRTRAGDVVLLEGALGTGKTVLVRGIAAGLEATGEVVSPTFVLVRHYHGRLPLVHADLYRLEARREIEALGLLELSEPGVLVVEWADRAPWLAAPDRLRLLMGPGADADSRTLRTLGDGPRHLLDALTGPGDPS